MIPRPLSSEELLPFNSDTMSGVFAGTRSHLFYRIRLGSDSTPNAPLRWYELHWSGEPPTVALYRYLPEQIDQRPTQIWAMTDLLSGPLIDRLQSGFDSQGYWLHACATCRFWTQSSASGLGEAPVGQCNWRAVAPDLAMQSALAPACARWQKADPRQDGPAGSPPNTSLSSEHPLYSKGPQRPEPKPTIWNRWRFHFRPSGTKPAQITNRALPVTERSGIGAGAQPCLVCSGRIGNLGAIVVDTPQGDSQTFSIWRCRSCYALFLNDWIDRWERLDSLETEESYYRLSPHEAYEILHLFDSGFAADHSESGDNREQRRLKILGLIDNLQPLSHQVKRGR